MIATLAFFKVLMYRTQTDILADYFYFKAIAMISIFLPIGISRNAETCDFRNADNHNFRTAGNYNCSEYSPLLCLDMLAIQFPEMLGAMFFRKTCNCICFRNVSNHIV